MRRYIIFFLLLCGVLSTFSCSNYYYDYQENGEHYLMTLRNNSQTNTVWVIPEHGNRACQHAGELPDKLLPDSTNVDIIRLDSQSSVRITILDNGISSVYETYHPEDDLKIYVFDKEQFKNTKWTELKSGKMWLHQFSLSVQDVVNGGYEVVYK